MLCLLANMGGAQFGAGLEHVRKVQSFCVVHRPTRRVRDEGESEAGACHRNNPTPAELQLYKHAIGVAQGHHE